MGAPPLFNLEVVMLWLSTHLAFGGYCGECSAMGLQEMPKLLAVSGDQMAKAVKASPMKISETTPHPLRVRRVS